METVTSFQIGDHVRLIGTLCTGRVMGLGAGRRLLVLEDGTGDWMSYPVQMWEAID